MKQNYPTWIPRSPKMAEWKDTRFSKSAKLKALYKIQEEISRKGIESNGIKVECKKGCNHCCHYRALITEQEALLIEEYSGVKKKNPKRARDLFVKPDPCPFLKNGGCSIYPVRPLACRGFFVFKPAPHYTACSDIDVHEYATVQLAMLQPDPEVSIGLLWLTGNIESSDMDRSFADIRDYFDKK